ncbi:MAG: peptidylprolyl isomerase [Bacillota bacterium]|nr:peptidylprolyl isomerase [Bacillota bacterium]
MDQLKKPSPGEEVAIIKTNHGQIKLRLFPQVAPKAVENFVTHSKNGYYKGVIFHRVIRDFMIQGGDPLGLGSGGQSIWGSAFEDEFSLDYRNIYGALSMANAGPNTNGSQFFIVQGGPVASSVIDQMTELGPDRGYPAEVVEAYKNLGGAYWLDGRHTVFGHVFEGMDVVEKIAALETNSQDRPLEDVVIEDIVIENF